MQVILRNMFSRRWIVLTILILLAAALCVRLGIWQLDRLEQRRIFNARVLSQISEPRFELTGNESNTELFEMEYRQVEVLGQYLFDHEVAIRNQVYENQPGVHLVTPLQINGSQKVILVDRGWIPDNEFRSGNWGKYHEPGLVSVTGVFRRSQQKADFGSRRDPEPITGEPAIKAWFFVNIPSISKQIPFDLIDTVYLQQSPDPGWTGFPKRSSPDIEISEGPHQGYAIQWFSFAIIALIGYPILILKQRPVQFSFQER